MYLRTAGVDRQLPDSTSITLGTTENINGAIRFEEAQVESNNTKNIKEDPTSTDNVDTTETPVRVSRTRKRSGASGSTDMNIENAQTLSENVANTPATRATRTARRKSTSIKTEDVAKTDHENVKCDIQNENLPSTVETDVDNAKNAVDVELEQTESEMEKVLDSLKKRKRTGSGQGPVSQKQLTRSLLQQTEEVYTLHGIDSAASLYNFVPNIYICPYILVSHDL